MAEGCEMLSPDDAVDVLEELLPAQNKSYELGLKLKLPQYVVEAIHSKDLPPDKYLLKVLIKFLQQVEPRPTWHVIVQTLRTPVVNLPALAEKIEATHIISSANAGTTTQINLPVFVEASSYKSVETVRSEIEILEDNFLQITCDTRALLSEKEKKDDNFLKYFIDYLLNFPVAKKAIHVKFFLENEDEILNAANIQKLFAILRRYCNYCNYEIIMHIVKKFGDENLNRRIRTYCDTIKRFEMSTTVSVYLKAISVLPDSKICKGFIQMAMKINKSISVCTLYEIRELKEVIAGSASVHSYSVYMESVAESSVLVHFLVHPACAQIVHATITPDFTYQYNVTVVEVSENGKWESCQQLNLKRSILKKVVRVLESPKNQEMELAQQVKEVLSETSLPTASDEDAQIAHGASMTRQPVGPPVQQLSLCPSPPPIPLSHPLPIYSLPFPPQPTLALNSSNQFNAKTIDDFDILKVLGRGRYSKVVICKEKGTGEILAMKLIKKDVVAADNEIISTLTEKRVLCTLQINTHPFLPTLKYSFQTPDRLCIVTEYVRGGDLLFHLDWRGVFTEGHARFYGAEITLGIQHLHQLGVIHRTITLDNLMLDEEGHIKIIDFGQCKEEIHFGDTTRTFCGVPDYMAPEVLTEGNYGRAVDWWGVGVVMYVMMCTKLPFDSQDHETLFLLIIEEEVKYPAELSQVARSLLGKLLEKDPKNRLGGRESDAEEVKSHNFFQPINWDDVYHKRIPPPFVPNIISPTSIEYFEKEFTDQNPQQTPPPSPLEDYGGVFKDF